MLLLGLSVICLCTLSFCASLALLLGWVRRLRWRGWGDLDFLHDTMLLSGSVLYLIIGNILQALIWAVLFVVLGEFETLGKAFYFALVSFTTLGYGDLVLSEARAILGPLAAANGAIMLGVSTSILFWIVSALIRATGSKLR